MVTKSDNGADLHLLGAAKPTKLPAPRGLSTSGKRLWAAVSGEWDLDVHEQLLLLQACRCADQLDRLAVESAKHGVTTTNYKGDEVPHPSLTEARQQSLVLARLLASLRMPVGDEGEEKRPQRRSGARGVYA